MPIIAQGCGTVKLLDFNNPERLSIRAALMPLRHYPDEGSEWIDRASFGTDSSRKAHESSTQSVAVTIGLGVASRSIAVCFSISE
jgi:hypothetical protein